MGIIIHRDIDQGTDEWLELRRGILTASEMKLIITPNKLQFARNENCKAHVYELAAQRVTQYVEPHYTSDAMLRGHFDEEEARAYYQRKHADVETVGFITNDGFGFTLGYSPDGLVGEEGCIEIKSRCQKYQFQTVVEGEMPTEFLLQIQTGLLVSGRQWCDFISYCGGMVLFVKRIHADKPMQEAILNASAACELEIQRLIAEYNKKAAGLQVTQRVIHEFEGEISV